MTSIVCSECKVEKPATTEFFHRKSSDGLRKRCKLCRKAELRTYYVANTDRVKANVKRWQSANIDSVNKSKRQSDIRHRDRKRAKSQLYREANRAEINRRERARVVQKEATDPCFRLRRLMSRQVWMSLQKAKDGWRWEALVGYTRQDLKVHIERQFTAGMTWAGVFSGDIHIDHIRPVSMFRYETPQEPAFRECWAITNLRPMWATDNMSKGSKRLHLL